MGHDISGYNKAGKEICYVRFGMSDMSSYLFYELFNANDYHAGVSGNGSNVTFTLPQVENAFKAFKDLNKKHPEIRERRQKEFRDFIKSCLETAKKEGSVRVFFG